jgi:hypothetical protein
MIDEKFPLDEIIFQNNVLKGGSDESIYDRAVHILVKSKNDTYTKKDYNLLSMARFSIGVDNVLKKELAKYYNT